MVRGSSRFTAVFAVGAGVGIGGQISGLRDIGAIVVVWPKFSASLANVSSSTLPADSLMILPHRETMRVGKS